MIKKKIINSAMAIALSAAVFISLGAAPKNGGNKAPNTPGHGNVYGKLRSTTQAQREAAAANRAALMKMVKARQAAKDTTVKDTLEVKP